MNLRVYIWFKLPENVHNNPKFIVKFGSYARKLNPANYGGNKSLLGITYSVNELMFSPGTKPKKDDIVYASSKMHPDYDPPLSYERMGRDIFPDADGCWRNVFGGTDVPTPYGDEKCNIVVHAAPMKHSVPCVGWLLLEIPPAPQLLSRKAVELGVPLGPLMGKLKKGQAVTFMKDGVEATVTPEQVLGPSVRGRRIAIAGDSCDSSALGHLLASEVSLIPEAGDNGLLLDTLVHEATMHSDHKQSALEKFHTTAAGAARFAASLNVRQLILTHFSQRYLSASAFHMQGSKSDKSFEDVAVLLHDAQSYKDFKGVIRLAEDLKAVKLFPV